METHACEPPVARVVSLICRLTVAAAEVDSASLAVKVKLSSPEEPRIGR
jgi:hypothetical protein